MSLSRPKWIQKEKQLGCLLNLLEKDTKYKFILENKFKQEEDILETEILVDI